MVEITTSKQNIKNRLKKKKMKTTEGTSGTKLNIRKFTLYGSQKDN